METKNYHEQLDDTLLDLIYANKNDVVKKIQYTKFRVMNYGFQCETHFCEYFDAIRENYGFELSYAELITDIHDFYN